MKLLLGTIIALLLAAVVWWWHEKNRGMDGISADEAAVLREQIAAIKAEQQRQILERQYIKSGSTAVAPPIETVTELENVKREMEETRAKLAALEAERQSAARDEQLATEEAGFIESRDLESQNERLREERLISQALLVAKVTEFVEDAELGNIITLDILMPEQVNMDTVLAVRRNRTGILGQIRVTSLEGTSATAIPMPGSARMTLNPGDELILPPRF
ncbi:MAG: hypothetical protein MUF04_06290 [Akkermansiaceae bacterium]|jgi:hypothetical protein|nr:hypothetical protein [Akkermansiaceae bacterium]